MQKKKFFESFTERELMLGNIGELLDCRLSDDHLDLRFTKGFGTISLYDREILRFCFSREEKGLEHVTPAVIRNPETFAPHMEELETEIKVSLENLMIRMQRSPFGLELSYKGQVVFRTTDGVYLDEEDGMYLFAEYGQTERIYGFGEKAGPIDKRGERIMMWNTDVPLVHNQRVNELYQSHPVFIAKKPETLYGMFLDNAGRTIFDFKEMGPEFCNEKGRYYIQTFHGDLDLYFYPGTEIRDVVKKHTYLTGPSFLPPIWALGYQQASWKYKSEEQVLSVVEEYKRRQIPIDVIYLDITYMDGYRVFTHDKEKFKNLKETIAKINEMGVKVVTIVDPGIKQDGKFDIFCEAVKEQMVCCYEDGKMFIGPVWPGDSVFPDFTEKRVRDWWGEKHQFYKELGVSGIWNDMNEPAVFAPDKAITMPEEIWHGNDGNPKQHGEIHNMYGMNMSRATYHGLEKLNPGKRPFIVGRAGYPGVQRYAAVWTGDNSSLWEHLELSISMGIGLSLSGISFFGPDAGGFNFDATGELMARWFEVGAVTPFFRNHYILTAKDQEPWNFAPEFEAVMKKYVEFRYQLLPYIYNQFERHIREYDPILRPLFYDYPQDTVTENLNDEFLLGESLLVAPVTKPGKFAREVWLPEGMWIDYWTKETVCGGQYVLKEAPLDVLPLYVRDASVLPLYPVCQSTEEKPKELTFEVYMQKEGSLNFCYYEDDGISVNSEELRIELKAESTPEAVEIELSCSGAYCPVWETLNIRCYGAQEKKILVKENGLPQGKSVRVI